MSYSTKKWEIDLTNEQCPHLNSCFVDFCKHTEHKGSVNSNIKICNFVHCPIKKE